MVPHFRALVFVVSKNSHFVAIINLFGYRRLAVFKKGNRGNFTIKQKMALGICLQSLVVVILAVPAYIVYMGYKMGEFDPFESKHIENCKRVLNNKPCEDVVTLSGLKIQSNSKLFFFVPVVCWNSAIDQIYINTKDGTFIFGCDFIKEYIHYGAIYSKLPWRERAIEVTERTGFGEMRRLNKEQTRLEGIPIRGYEGSDFHPHGIFAVKNKTPKEDEWIFVINHRRDGEFVSIFKVANSSSGIELEYFGSVTNDQWTYLNDLAVIPDSEGVFYVSNWFEHDVE
ncbi:hypothetical protein RFI_05095 [Reticulomyxa filosa]|uniref:Uncharacterized protein n=1 Tax=Reticulomyxa filosa TaxID=46433 RepID=X6P1S7_RETFI|nr:hypothetical protein RFI_05095 [Reticulomyxa filosa]|eukprot:ETO32019.1 hypothetical protein RFI_05095 [Reticulomyxa filosa]